jgi:hypothetical protein
LTIGREIANRSAQAPSAASGGAFWRRIPRFNHGATFIWHTAHMPDESPLTLRHADQVRTDFAIIESDLEFIMTRLARLPTRGDLAKTALGIILSTAALVILWDEVFWRL